MRFIIGIFLICFAVAWAQEPTTSIISETTFNADVVVIPFPTRSTTVTFALTDETAPNPVTLKFNYPSTDTLASWALESQSDIETRIDDASEAVKGLGGDPSAAAIAAAYQDLIEEQKKIEERMQRYLDAVVKIRCMMEILRQFAAVQ